MQLPSEPIEHMDDILLEREIEVDEDGTLCSDVPCRKCGYNLKTLSLHVKCTECGCPVIDSILHPRELSGWRRFVAKTVDVLAFLTVWYFCTIEIRTGSELNTTKLAVADNNEAAALSIFRKALAVIVPGQLQRRFEDGFREKRQRIADLHQRQRATHQWSMERAWIELRMARHCW